MNERQSPPRHELSLRLSQSMAVAAVRVVTVGGEEEIDEARPAR